jgi:ribulose-5-phosphate 4-epimerase/fuculose-1-phosphate aldolase
MILRNHGLLTAGKTISEAFMLMYYLDRACKVQIDLLNTNQKIIKPSENLLEFAAGQYNDPKYQLGKHEWPALKRMLDKNNSIYSQ